MYRSCKIRSQTITVPSWYHHILSISHITGNFYAQGVGSERNPKLAVHWWKEASNLEAVMPSSSSVSTEHSPSSQPLLPDASVTQAPPEQSLLTGLSDLLQNQA